MNKLIEKCEDLHSKLYVPQDEPEWVDYYYSQVCFTNLQKGGTRNEHKNKQHYLCWLTIRCIDSRVGKISPTEDEQYFTNATTATRGRSYEEALKKQIKRLTKLYNDSIVEDIIS